MKNTKLRIVSLLHVANDGFQESIVLLLPFIALELNLNLAEIGFLGSTIKILGIFLALPAAYIANRVGIFKVLLLAAVGYSLAYIGSAFSQNLWQIFVFFFMAGSSFGVFHSIAFAYIAHTVDRTQRANTLGNFTAAGDIGRVMLTGFIAVVATHVGWRGASFSYGGIGLLVVAVSWLFANQFNKKNNQVKVDVTPAPPVSYKRFLREFNFILSIIAGFFDSFASGSLFIFLPFLLIAKGINPVFLGLFSAAFFVGNFVGKMFLTRLTNKFSYAAVLIPAELMMAGLIVCLILVTQPLVIAVIAVLLGIVTKGTAPVLVALRSDTVDHLKNYEKAFGISSVIGNISGTMSPFILGLAAERYGINAAFYIMAAVVLLVIVPTVIFKLRDTD